MTQPEDPGLPGVGRGGRYELFERIGQGAMGVVYRANDREAHRDVALKTLRVWDPEEIYRLKKEFRSLADVSHPNLAKLHELVVHEDQCFLTMELLHGTDLVSWARARKTNPGALRDALRQLALGLEALHQAGLLHRDVKPTNVLVEPSGRVVILDFGLASGLHSGMSQASRVGVVAGTPDYMAPEQAWGEPLTPAADWYGVGVMLFECLTGQLPFRDGVLNLLKRRRSPPPAPRSLNPETPLDLDELTSALLRSDPAERLSGAEMLARLGPASVEPKTVPSRPQIPRPGSPFVGREAELARLREAYAQSRDGAAVALRLEGPSGIGKTALIEHFLEEVQQEADVLVLRARCRFQEAVRFNAVDGVVDELSRYLVRLPPDQLEVLKPRNLRALTRVFPVLQRVPFAPSGTEAELSGAEPHEVRRRAFAALRELLARIADRQPVVAWIDDIQWGDADSAPILAEALRQPDAPPLLLLLSHREDSREYSPFLAALEAGDRSLPLPEIERLTLGPLDPADARKLVLDLLGAVPEDLQDSASAVAAHAAGSPFLIGELARSLRGAAADGSLLARLESTRLADVVRQRVASLPTEARRVLELVCVAGSPIESSVALDAAGAAEGARALVDELRHESLLRVVTTWADPLVETYHDRIRESVLEGLGETDRRGHHRALADTMERSGRATPALLARHLHGAGDLSRAADQAALAGDRASEGLAFAQAADFYRQALEWKVGEIERTRDLLTRRANALVNAGRSSEAAPLFLVAAEGAAQQQSWDLRRQAAEKYLASGLTDDGIAILRPLLSELGLQYPASTRSAVISTLLRVAELRIRGTRLRRKPEGAQSTRDLARIDLCYSAARGLITVDTMRAGYLPLVGLLLALRAGEPSRVARSLAIVGGAVLAPLGGSMGSWGVRLIEQARGIAAELDDPYLTATVAVCGGQVAVLRGEWSSAVQQSQQALRILREHCRGVDWEKITGQMAELRGLEEIGQMSEVFRRATEMAIEAEDRGDRYGAVVAAGLIASSGVAVDLPDESRAQLHTALERWSREGFLIQHLYAARSDVLADLYQGRAGDALQRVRDIWPSIERAFLLRTPITRIDSHLMRARAALAVAASTSKDTAELLRLCKSDARLLGKEGRPDTTAYAAALRAGIAGVRGDRERALGLLDEAEHAYERAEIALSRACVQRRSGELIGGDEGREQVARADEFMLAVGVSQPSRWVAVCAPGFSLG
jgi:tetratricopeptide (TPR) repeat protein/predicted Ser/Thr protein kinase